MGCDTILGVVKERKEFISPMKNFEIQKSIILMTLLLCGLFTGVADDSAYSGYVTLKADDSLNSNSWNSGKNWNDGKAPSPDKNYYVPAGKQLCFKNSDKNVDIGTWGGGKLAIAGTALFNVNAGYGYAPYIPDLTICAGGVVMWYPYGPFSFSSQTSGERGIVRIEGTESNPSILSHHDANVNSNTRTYTLCGLFKGVSENVLVLERPEENYEGKKSCHGCECYVPSDAFADYRGTFRIQGATMLMAPSKNTIFNWPSTHLSVSEGATLKLFHDGTAVKESTTNGFLRALSVADSSVRWKYVANNAGGCVFPVINASEGIDIGSGSKIEVAAKGYDLLRAIAAKNQEGDSFPIMRVPSSVNIDENMLASAVVSVTNAAEAYLPVKLSVAERVEGYKDIVLSSPDIVVMTNSATQTSSGGAFTAGHEGDWTNGEVPAAGTAKHYWIGQTVRVIEDIALPESVLSVDAAFHCTGGSKFEFKEMNLCGGNMIFWSGSEERVCKANKLNVYSSENTIASSTPYIIVDAEICGNGNLTLRNNDNGYGKIRLECKNTNYTGRVVVTQQGKNADKTIMDPYKFNFYLNDANNLGGKYDGDDSYRAITFSKFPTMTVIKNSVFSDSTRGMLVQGGAKFAVQSGCTLVLSNQVTYAGVLLKTGSGVLELGGTARFIDGNADTLPLASTNVLNVADGSLRISSKHAADGLSIIFEQGSKLLIPADTEAGYYNVKWDEPLVVNTNDGKLPVRVEGLDAKTAINVEVPICTFSAAAAANISEDAFNVSVKSGRRPMLKSVKKVANEDGTVSYVATFGRYGSRIILR